MIERLRLGILGTANIADAIITAANKSKLVEICAVAGRDADKTRAWADERKIETSFGSYQTLLNSGSVDAVYIPLPNSLHAEWSIKALEAGLAVLCEKPICTSKTEALRVTDAANKFGLPIMEGFMYWRHPLYKKVRNLIEEGEIGKLSSINSCFSWMCDDRSEIPANAELKGGALFDVGCYCVHLSRMITGHEPSRVVAFERRSTVDDTMMGILDFPDGVLSQFETSIANYERHRVEIVGRQGAIEIEKPWVNVGESCKIFLHREGKNDRTIEIEAADCYLLELEAFADMVWKNETAAGLMDDSIANLAVLDALLKSADRGCAVDVI